MLARLIRFIVRHGVLLAVISLALLIVPAALVPKIGIDNSLDIWMSRDADDFRRYQEFLRRFGSDEMIVIAVPMPDPLSSPAMALQREVASALRQIRGVRLVTSLPDALNAMLGSGQNREVDLRHPLLRNLLISEDGKTAGMVLFLEPPRGANARRDLVAAVMSATDPFEKQGYSFHVVGAPVLNVALDQASGTEAKRLIPFAALVSVGMMIALFRSVMTPMICLAAAGAGIAWTVALMAASGTAFNLMSIALPALLMVLSLAPCVHLAERFLSKRAMGTPRGGAMRQTLRELVVPLVMTTVTTAIGFASLMVTTIQPVFDVGVFAVIGVLLSLVLAIAMVPGLIQFIPAPEQFAKTSRGRNWTVSAAEIASRHSGKVAGLSLVLLVPLGWMALRIRTETNVLSFLPEESRVAMDYRFVSQRLTGLYTLEMDVSVPADQAQAAEQGLCLLGDNLQDHPQVARVDHHGLYASQIRQSGLSSLLPAAFDPLQQAAKHFRATEGDSVRLRASVLVRSMASSDFQSVIDAVEREAARDLPASARWNLTGVVLLMSRAQASLVQTQVRSFAIALPLVLIVMGLLLRSWRVMVASIVPNVIPILAMFTWMSVAGLSINPATVMIASVAIGLAVDGTIHFMASYLRENRSDPVVRSVAAMTASGRPIVFSALVAAAGFSLLAMARFAPLREFGLLTGFTLIVAMLCDVLITPAWAVFLRVGEGKNASK